MKKQGPKFLTFKQGVAICTKSLFGNLHFGLKATADGVANAEASIVHKLTGISKAHLIEDRHNKTEETQEKIKAEFSKISNAMASTFKRKSFRDAADIVHEAHANS
jgi:hypothetical protein